MNTGLIYIQLNSNGIHPVCAELLSKCSELVDEVSGILICSELTPNITLSLKNIGFKRVYIYIFPSANVFLQEVHKLALINCVNLLKPEILLFGATLEGRTLASMVGAFFNTGVTADCTELSLNDKGQLVQTRPAFGGRIMASILTKTTRPQIATVRQGVFKAQTQENRALEIIKCELPKNIPLYLKVENDDVFSFMKQENRSIVIAVGGGLKEKSDLVVFEKLAKKLDADLMCSRVLVERGFFLQNQQIGMSGNAVSADLLLCFGISGSVQFLSGIKGVKCICAINVDRESEIMKVADYPMLCDMYGVANAMINTSHFDKNIGM